MALPEIRLKVNDQDENRSHSRFVWLNKMQFLKMYYLFICAHVPTEDKTTFNDQLDKAYSTRLTGFSYETRYWILQLQSQKTKRLQCKTIYVMSEMATM